MQEQSNPVPTGCHGLTSASKSKTVKYRSTKISGRIFAIALIIHGLISIFQNSLKNAPFPFEYEFLNLLTFFILSIIFIIYILILRNNSKSKSKKLIKYLFEDLKYLIFPVGFIFALLSILNLKWFNDFVGFISALLGIFGLIQKPSSNHISVVQNISSDPQSQRHERTRLLVDNLRSENRYSKINAIQGLASIADEWLRDPDPPEDQARKNGQNIINILCEYIRSPFPLARKAIILSGDTPPADYAGDFFADQATFREEQEVRRSIFNEISVRLHPLDEKEKRDYTTWHVFEFDFSKSTIFYPLNRLRFFSPNFRNSKFFGLADFSFSDFQGIPIFADTHYFGDVSFSCACFQGTALFSNSCFEKELNFQATTLKAGAIFDSSIFKGPTIITPALQDGQVSFDGSIFSCSSVHKFLDLNHLDIPTINIKSVTLVGKRRCKRYEAKIPVNSHLYDPDSWDEKQQKYTRVSKPAE